MKRNMKKSRKMCYGLIVLVFTIVLNYSNAFCADDTIPDKVDFYQHTREVYEHLDYSKDQTEQLIEDYKNRYVMYTSISYVLGRDFDGKRFGYNDSSSRATAGGMSGGFTSNIQISDKVMEFLKSNGCSPGINVGNQAHQNTLRYAEEIKYWCELFNVDAAVFTAIIADESSGNPEAQGDGSYGLTQIQLSEHMGPYTRKDKNGQSYTINVTGKETFVGKPELQIQYGVMYFSEALEACQYNYVAALVYYNQGPNSLKNMVKSYQSDTGDSRTFTEIMADTECYEYLKYRKGYKGTEGYVEYVLKWINMSDLGKGYNDLYVYFQGKNPPIYNTREYYGDKKYGASTLAKSGTGPTILAMLVRNISGNIITPDTMAKYSSKYYVPGKGSSIDILYDVEQYGLKVRNIGNDLTKLREGVSKGDLAVAIVGNQENGAIFGTFARSSEGNFVVLFDYDEKTDTILVYDVDGGNWEKLSENGFRYSINYIDGEAIGGFLLYSKK